MVHSQMTPAEISETSAIAKVGIMAVKIIRTIKTFKISGNKLPTLKIENVNDIILICEAVCDFKKPIYHD